MLIQTIDFGMHNTSETYSVPNTEENYEIIAGNRFTRQIKFAQKFSFQATKEMKAPTFFIETLFAEYIDATVAIEESEIYNYDEMVGSF
jgi:hypothetical protein